jgi:hypothetical protein
VAGPSGAAMAARPRRPVRGRPGRRRLPPGRRRHRPDDTPRPRPHRADPPVRARIAGHRDRHRRRASLADRRVIGRVALANGAFRRARRRPRRRRSAARGRGAGRLGRPSWADG